MSGESSSDEFQTFLKERTTIKRNLYGQIVARSVSLSVLGLLLGVISGPIGNFFGIFGQLLFVIGNMIRVIGVCIYSTVPTDEADFWRDIVKKEGKILRIFWTISISIACFGLAFLYSIPFYYGRYVYLPQGLWYLWNLHPETTYDLMVVRTFLLFICAPVPKLVSLVYLIHMGTENYGLKLIMGINLGSYVCCFTYMIAMSLHYISYLWGTNQLYFLYKSSNITLHKPCYPEGYGSTIINCLIYCASIMVGINFSLNGLAGLLYLSLIHI